MNIMRKGLMWVGGAGLAVWFLLRKPAPLAAKDLPHMKSWSETGIASWYGPGYEGNTTANGEIFDKNAMTAAHKKLPFNSRVLVTDLDTQKKVIVRINDRGPFVSGRIIDLSYGAAETLGMIEKGLANVKIEVI